MNREQLKTLCALEGISGREQAVRAYLQQQLRDLPAVESMTVFDCAGERAAARRAVGAVFRPYG